MHWDYIESGGEPAMSIQSAWYVTNLTNKKIWILRAYLEKPRTDGSISFPEYSYDNVSISPRDPTKVVVDFCIQPPTCKEGEIFKGKIVFIDHSNKQYKVKVALKPPIQVGAPEDDDIPF